MRTDLGKTVRVRKVIVDSFRPYISELSNRPLLSGIIGLMPSCALKILLMRRILGWEVHGSARIGPCLFRGVGKVTVRKNASIAGLCVFLHVGHLEIGEGAIMGYWNWLGAAPTLRSPALDARTTGEAAHFKLGDYAAITSRHYVDCSGGVEIGRFSVIAGVRSTILTHQVDTVRSQQILRAVQVGEYCLVGSNVQIVPGASIADRSVIAMGSVVVGILESAACLYGGVPARRIKQMDGGAYFEREQAFAEIP